MEAIANVMPEAIETAPAPTYINGSHALMQALVAEGVDTIFGYPGGAIMPVYDALYDFQERINHILVRHEQGAGHAAEGYARVTGRAGVCLVTSGPGATNLVTAIADALIDSTPLVCVVGQVAKKLLGTDAFQEADVMGVTMPITKWNYQITSADEVPEVISKAFYIAQSGRPGPVLIDITKSAQLELMTKPFAYERCQSIISYKPRRVPKQEQVEAAAKLINSAKKPYILVGHGVQIAKAEDELREFVEKTGIPVATTLLGQSTISTAHPLYVGWLGMHGNYGPNVMTDQADVIIAIGMRFDDRVTGDASKYIKQAKVVHIEIDPAEIDKIIRADAPVVGDAKEVLKALIPLVNPNDHTVWRNEFRKYDAIEKETITVPELTSQTGKIKMAEVIDLLSKKTKGESILVTDVGQHQMMASRYYQFRRPNSLVTSGGMGTMGFALPAAFGAQVGAPDRQVVAIIGDGCFQMTLQELGTIVQNKQPVKAIILNNNFLGMVRQWQQLFHERRYSFVELQNPDFVTIAKGFGMAGHTCNERESLSDSLDNLLNSDGPYLLEVIVEKEENVFPMVPAGASVAQIRLK
ncbi:MULTISPECIES: biosynthetic-type acetolactate synthase large subunit [unclassified Spirosoma]|uniref:biosynthetic-type acetolactate synthase large subunit n=1 Tax=unclassified Spirosoma TaxID=2621999 RepID=UPI0009600947|nr:MULTISPECIES: biosynthetic-type acetolactate synthase large subunit [unclassified Spirosoma]MBN8824246.1 biosynthetic-type acetolactate synthase large subunit [Spirosoma sp.]OJW78976.1 MAG: acetolactate synthase, large subunit, biosynthetic type [Spirosoma sp. 48-14]